jgi:hypothetical protein
VESPRDFPPDVDIYILCDRLIFLFLYKYFYY